MIHFLRNKNNQTIIETTVGVETYDDGRKYVEVSSGVNVTHYSIYLLSLPRVRRNLFIAEIDQLYELRGWFWERYLIGKKNTAELRSDVEKKIARFYKAVATEYTLGYVTD